MEYTKKILIYLLVLSFSGLNVTQVFATDFSSTNFISRDPVITDFGGNASSTNFQQINAGGQSVTGESTSSGYILRSGFLYYDDFSPRSQNWRWFSDYASETPVSALAGENIAPSTIGAADTIKLRTTILETADIGFLNTKYKLQYSLTSDFNVATDVVEIGNCTGVSIWCYALGGGLDNATITTKTLTDAESCIASAGNGCGTHNTSGVSASSFNHKRSRAVEYEFTIKNSGAPVNNTYFFRTFDVLHNRAVLLVTGKSYPSLVTADASMTFIISGLPAGTNTGGVVTNASSTSISVNFGSLPFGSAVAVAQRATVTTNAASGYTIFVFQTQGLLGPIEIPPIPYTNASPGPWGVGAATGAYGYHSTDATLSGGSTRFAVDNTYSKLESAAREVVYSSGPVTGEINDLVFKTEVTQMQPAGAYVGYITYIVVPVF